ncbi:MAG: PEGA domain-containing protein [Myxococcota bacterium]
MTFLSRAVLIGLVWTAVALPLQAQDVARERIYVVAAALDPELEDEAARAAAAARAALRSVDGADWQAADQRFLGYDDNTLARLVEARENLSEGRAAYVDLRLDEAVTLLEAAVDNFNQAMSALEDPSDLGNALLYLGAAQAFNGDDRGAQATFRRLHIQMSHIRPDPNEFPPDVVSRWEAAAPRRSDGVVSVESDPPGAVAYVDFIPRGLTPLTVDGLARGEHTVRVTAPGATPYIENVEITRRQREGSVAAFLLAHDEMEGLPEAVRGITGHELQVGDGAIAEVAQFLELDKIGVIRVSYGDSQDTVKLELVMFDVSSQRRVLRGEVQAPRAFGELEAVVQRSIAQGVENVLNPQVGEDDERIPAETVITGDNPESGEREDPLYKKWWLWAAVGGAVVLGAVIAIAVTQSGGNNLGRDQGGQVVFEF